MKPTFEFCALSFLVQWIGHERLLHRYIKTDPTPDQVRQSLRYFQVARSFPGLKILPEQTSSRVCNALKQVRTCDAFTPVEKVSELADEFGRRVGKRSISAGSKLLWLSFRRPFIIYDDRAAQALMKEFKCKFKKRDYESYYQAWRDVYGDHKSRIKNAVAYLPEASVVIQKCGLSDKELAKLAKGRWFHERVLDKYLWIIGAAG